MKKTVILMVSDERGVWNNVGSELLEGIVVGRPMVVPFMDAEAKTKFAEQCFERVRPTEVFEHSVVVKDHDLMALQFFDVEEATIEEAASKLKCEDEEREPNDGDEE